MSKVQMGSQSTLRQTQLGLSTSVRLRVMWVIERFKYIQCRSSKERKGPALGV